MCSYGKWDSLGGFVCVEVLRPSQPNGVMSIYLTTRLLARLSPLSGLPVLCAFFRLLEVHPFTFSGSFFTRVVDIGHGTVSIYGPHQAKMCLWARAKFTDSDSSHACAKSHPVICLPLVHCIVCNDSVSGRRRPWSDCADLQSDLGLWCPHMPEDTFPHGRAHIISFSGMDKLSGQITLSNYFTNLLKSVLL